jgi:UDP-N-acetylmuramate dehydrogenase
MKLLKLNSKIKKKQRMTTHELTFRENIPLKDFCTFGIGGPARYFSEIRTISEMQQAIASCIDKQLPYMILGKGSNCLFDDRGFNGAVLLNKIDFFEQKEPGKFHIGAGYSFALLGVQTARQGWEGLEFASGIPASVGGAVFMNAGAKGNDTSKALESVDYISENGDFEILERKDLTFSYRHSPFQQMRGAIVGATFALTHSSDARKRQIEMINVRKKTQPYGAMSAGCVFLNPHCESAGALIEKCGLKGMSIGDAQVSLVHANFLINVGNASCEEMLELIKLVKKRVKELTNIELESEVRYIPY